MKETEQSTIALKPSGQVFNLYFLAAFNLPDMARHSGFGPHIGVLHWAHTDALHQAILGSQQTNTGATACSSRRGVPTHSASQLHRFQLRYALDPQKHERGKMT